MTVIETIAMNTMIRLNAEGTGQVIHIQAVLQKDNETIRRTRSFGVGFDENPTFLSRTIGDELHNLIQHMVEDLFPIEGSDNE